MARTTDIEVKKIISLNKVTDTTPFIDTANLLVTKHLGNSGLSDEELTQIEKYLTAHLLTLHNDERQLKTQKLGDATDTYAGNFGKGLEFSQYGQMVLMLDSTGTMQGLGGKKVSLSVINVND
jgi:hypothetical protein